MKTTFEMDSLFDQEDIDNRHSVMLQCKDCNKWTRHTDYLINRKHLPCSNCGLINYDPSSIRSIRSYKPETDNKRRPTSKKKK